MALKSVVAGLRAKGEWTLAADLNAAPLPDAVNSAIDYVRASGSIAIRTPGWFAFYQLDDPYWPLSDPELAKMRACVAENGAALALAASGSHKSSANWGIVVKSPVIAVRLSNLSDARTLAKLLQAAAYDAHARGDDAEALDRLSQILALSRAVDTPPHYLTVLLVSMGCEGLATAALEEMAASLVIEPALPVQPAGRAATRRQLVALLADLTADTACVASWHQAVATERVMQLDTANLFIAGQVPPTIGTTPLNGFAPSGWQAAIKGYVLNPIIRQDTRAMSGSMAQLIAAGECPDWPTALRIAGDPDRYTKQWYFHPWAAEMQYSFEKSLRVHYQRWTDRRLAATALALRVFVADHGGKMPNRLDDLVPRYLPRLPIDPFARDGPAPLHYRPRGDDPLLYGVGVDGLDDGGSDVCLRKRDSHWRWNHQDVVVHLTPQPRE